MTDDTVTAKLAEWEALANAATKGPWDTDGGGTSVGHGDKWVAHVVDQQEPNEPVQARADAEFIAAAPDLARSLLGFVKEVQHILATQRHEVIGARGLREQDVVRARDIEQAARKWIGGEGRG